MGFVWWKLQGVQGGWNEKSGSQEKMVPDQTLKGLTCPLQLGLLKWWC